MLLMLRGVAMLLLVSATAQSQSLTVKLKDGSRHSFPLIDITKITFGTVTGVGDPGQVSGMIKTFALFQNYPNPFNPTTTIQYDIPRAGSVEISINDINGRILNRFWREYSQGGTYQLQWDANDDKGRKLASGLYFYQVKFEQSVVSKKMLLLK